MAVLKVIFVSAAIAAIAATSADSTNAAPASAEGPTYDEWQAKKDASAQEKAAKDAKQSKMAAVDKVISLMEGLKAKILQEGENEAHSYDKFACFCKDTMAAKQASIKKGEDQKETLEATIAELSTDRDELDDHIKELQEIIAEAEAEIKKATATRKDEKALYDKNAADLIGALEALEAAIKTLKSSKVVADVGFLQIQGMAKTVQKALILADALGLRGATRATQMVAALLQQNPGVPMQDYDFHSDSIIETLEKLLADFHGTKVELDEAEVKSQQEYDMFIQDKRDLIKNKTAELENSKKRRDSVIAEIQEASQELSTVSAQLLADQEYLTELAQMCHDHAITWDQRTQMRADELATLTSAMTIIKEAVSQKTTANTVRLVQKRADLSVARVTALDSDAMDALEANAEALEGSPDSFLQIATAPRVLLGAFVQKRSAKPASAKEAVIDTLRTVGSKIKSTLLLRLATQIQADHFAKVKKLIQELIERLLAQAAAETNQKGWCDKAIGDAEQKRENAAEAIAEINAEMATLEAKRDKLKEEIEVLEIEIAELNAARDEATKLREEQHQENAQTVEDAKAGLEAVDMAIDILSKFYKTAAKAEVSMVQGPADDAPDAGFKAFEAYKGAQGSATGILGMLDVIKSDFERTIKVTEEEEAKAQAEYDAFMTETGKVLAEKNTALEEKQGYLDDTLEKLSSAQEKLDLESSLLKEAIKALIELQPPCVDTGMSYEERVAMREEEIEGLKKALCVLNNYQEYGPDGAAEGC
jgi:hypothetical protein